MDGIPMLLWLLGQPAAGHGGAHELLDVHVVDGRPHAVTTWGLLHPPERANGDWTWTCEEVSGFEGDAWAVAPTDGGWVWGTLAGTASS